MRQPSSRFIHTQKMEPPVRCSKGKIRCCAERKWRVHRSGSGTVYCEYRGTLGRVGARAWS
eukprot:1694213-Prymnesium_polylepis.1